MTARPRPLFLLAAVLLPAAPAHASGIDLFSAETLFVSGDARLVGVAGERSWVDGGFGKLRSSGTNDGDFHAQPELGTADLVWQPRFGWAMSATIVGTLQGGERTEAGLSEAYLSFKPLSGGSVRFSGRVGLMWVPVSLEHAGADWHVADTITPSAINSWVGEEVRPAAIEATASADIGAHKFSATAAIFAANDTSGTLLTFRGWALHDRKTLAFRRQPLPPLPEEIEYYQAEFTHPLLDVGSGFARQPGYYAKLAWEPPLPIRLELFRYDNRADPTVLNEDLEWGWRTRFNHAGAVARLGASTDLKIQALTGRTKVGWGGPDGISIDCKFRSAFALLTHDFGLVRAAGRIEAFDTKQRGALVTDESAETGWAATLAAQHDFGANLTGIAEILHVSSNRPMREEVEEEEEEEHESGGVHALPARQRQTQVQIALRWHW